MAVSKITNDGVTGLTIDSSGVVTHPQKPYVSVEFGGGTNYISHTNEPVKFDNVFDGDASLYNTSTYKFTCPVDGVYFMSFNLLIQTAAAIDISVFKNSTMQNRTYVSVDRGITSAYAVLCSANDEIYWYVNGGSSFFEGTGTNKYSWGTYTLIG